MVRTFNPDRVPTRPLVLSASVACQALPPPFAALAGELCDGNPSQVPTTALDVTALRAHLYDDTILSMSSQYLSLRSMTAHPRDGWLPHSNMSPAMRRERCASCRLSG